MSLFDKMKQGAADAAKAAQQTMELAKLKSLIALKQREIGKQKKAIGEAVYDAYRKEDIASSNETAFRLCQGIVTAEHEIASLEDRILKLRATKTCAICGRESELDADICSGCGNSFTATPLQPAKLEEEVRVLCGSCKAENAMDARSCVSCGKALGSWR